MMKTYNAENVKTVGKILNDTTKPLTERFRALFTLKNIGGKESVESIAECFSDQSALLKHELAYCLGQMQNKSAIPVLVTILKDVEQHAMVRHEAGEALGAIGSSEVIDILKDYSKDPIPEVAETCQLAVKRIEWLNSPAGVSVATSAGSSTCAYTSVDPAPPTDTPAAASTQSLRSVLLDETEDLFTRYRAMFALRNCGDTEAVLALADGLGCKSALFRHEIAYVLGQVRHPAALPRLTQSLRDCAESAMVRHECAEAIGSIAQSDDVLSDFVRDPEPIVRQSCLVALDMSEYEKSEELEYADGLKKVNGEMISRTVVEEGDNCD